MPWLHRALSHWYRLLHIAVVAAFFAGFFFDIRWFAIGGGIVMVAEDLYEIHEGTLKHQFPALLALILAWLIDPWYMGVFWASAMFHVLNIPGDLLVLFTSRKKMETAKKIRDVILAEESERKE